MAPLTPRSSAVSSPSRGEITSTPEPQDTIVRSLADWERKQELLERQSVRRSVTTDIYMCSKQEVKVLLYMFISYIINQRFGQILLIECIFFRFHDYLYLDFYQSYERTHMEYALNKTSVK